MMDEKEMQELLKWNLCIARARIEAAAERVHRDPAAITLIAVSKTVEPARILAAYELGLRHFGENRVEEAATKAPALAADMPEAIWHMIGHLQSRKAPRAVQLFDLIHSVDSVHLAAKLDRQAASSGKKLPILLELNISGEESKSGFPLALSGEMAEQTPAFAQTAREILALEHVQVRGLMTMAPIVPQPELARPYFRRLRAWREWLAEQFPALPWTELSMGMTDDFEVAIEEGATMLRLGRAIFALGPSARG